jgi:hypothetical protein
MRGTPVFSLILLLLTSCASLSNIDLSDKYKQGNITIETDAKMVEGMRCVYTQTYQYAPSMDFESVCVDLANKLCGRGYTNGVVLVEIQDQGKMGNDYTPSQSATYQASFYKE